jgi:predicted transcriptional regulator
VAGNGLEPRRSVVSKVVAIVRSFGSGGSLTVTEIAQVANLPLSTTHRLVHELAAWGSCTAVTTPGSRSFSGRCQAAAATAVRTCERWWHPQSWISVR